MSIPAHAAEPVLQSSPAVKNALTPEQRQKNLESFDLVWTTIRDSHYDPKLGGVNWQQVTFTPSDIAANAIHTDQGCGSLGTHARN